MRDFEQGAIREVPVPIESLKELNAARDTPGDTHRHLRHDPDPVKTSWKCGECGEQADAMTAWIHPVELALYHRRNHENRETKKGLCGPLLEPNEEPERPGESPVRAPPHCKHCGSPIERKLGSDGSYENLHRWRNRKYCDVACGKAARTKLAKETPAKTCEHCSAPFRRKSGISVKEWKIRRYCSRKCSRAARIGMTTKKRSREPRKTCEICGEEYGRKLFTGRSAESFKNFEIRKTCGKPACMRASQKATNAGKIVECSR